jgi:methionyl aminopeptidase
MLSKILPPKVVSLPDADGHFNPFPAFMFTGPLRPVYPLSPRRAVPEKIRHPDYAHNGIPRSEQVCPGSLVASPDRRYAVLRSSLCGDAGSENG